MNPQYELLKKYSEIIGSYKELADVIEQLVKLLFKNENVPIAYISNRIKTLESFLDKVQRKRYKDPFVENTDFAGVRIVYLYKDDLPEIINIIKSNFNVIETTIKSDNLEKNEFGYEACHFLVQISDTFNGPIYNELKGHTCEIQVRTILQDAWFLVSHHLDYKNQNEFPKNLSRKLYALAGGFETIDDQLIEIRKGRQEYVHDLKSKKLMELLDEPIYIDSLKEYLKLSFPELQLETSHGIINDYPAWFRHHGVETIGEIDSLVKRTKEARIAFNNEETFGRSAAREIFVALGFVNEDSRESFALEQDRLLLTKFEKLVE